MQEIPIRTKIPDSIFCEGNSQVTKLKVNDEWIIVCRLYDRLRGSSLNFNWIINSIEIHRENSAGEFLVSGELRLTLFGNQIFQDKFSHLIKTGSTFTEICSNVNLSYSSEIWFEGFVNISDIRKEQPNRLANEESKLKIQQKSLEELSNDFERLLQPDSPCIADITLKCGTVSILAHKTILSARSSVFAAMFAHPMKESLKNEVDITDTGESTLRELLKYMYTGKTSDLTIDSAANLLFAADKYQLQDLKTVCVYFLKNTVSLQNVWKILVFGELHSSDLKSFAVDYICRYCGKFSAIENTQEWKEMRKERPDLAMNLLESLVKHRDEK